MQTVNFKCGHCGQLMAVGRENLGQQVRCPHCQQIVLAPNGDGAAPAAEPPAPSPFGDLREHEDIFTQKSETDDVLFGGADAPRMEMPHDQAPAATVGYNGPPVPDLAPITDPPEPAHDLLPVTQPPLFAGDPPPTATTEQPHWSPAAASPTAALDQPAYVPPRQARERKESFVSMTFLLLVFAPTLLWALGATAIGFWLYGKATAQQNNPQQNQFELMIDDGDDRGVKKKGQARGKMQTTEKMATAPLPDSLKTTIGKPITVGDLEVTPMGVSRRKVGVVVGGRKPQDCLYDSLVLDLKFKNLSDVYAFAPLDNYFDRQYKGVGKPPLTLLVAGERKFYGGSHKWVPVIAPNAKNWEPRQWPKGRKETDPVGLRPGEEGTGYVCTDGWDEKTADFLLGNEEEKKKPYHGELVWRVHVRRGPYDYRGHLLTATAVIGVEFTDKQIVALD